MRSVNERTRFIITVDTETYEVGGLLPPFGANLYGEVSEGSFGVPKIMEICDRHEVKATFFVDVFMHRRYGEGKVGELCRRIQDAGHDVQLHAHMSWLPDSKSDRLSALPLERQVQILAEGKDCIRKAIGKPPVAFRAGSYAANLDTIEALRRNDILLDSSYFAFNQKCPLSCELDHRYGNKLFKINGVFEIPVTTFWLVNQPFYRKITKTDINGASLSEMSDAIPQLLARKMRFIILFLHSFSFIRWKRDCSGIVPNYRAVERFDRILRLIRTWDHDAQFCTMAQALTLLRDKGEEEQDFIPTVSPWRVFPRALQRILE